MEITLLIILCILLAVCIVLASLYRDKRQECDRLFEQYLSKREEVIRLKSELRNMKAPLANRKTS